MIISDEHDRFLIDPVLQAAEARKLSVKFLMCSTRQALKLRLSSSMNKGAATPRCTAFPTTTRALSSLSWLLGSLIGFLQRCSDFTDDSFSTWKPLKMQKRIEEQPKKGHKQLDFCRKWKRQSCSTEIIMNLQAKTKIKMWKTTWNFTTARSQLRGVGI